MEEGVSIPFPTLERQKINTEKGRKGEEATCNFSRGRLPYHIPTVPPREAAEREKKRKSLQLK